jgi:hypothetical protein
MTPVWPTSIGLTEGRTDQGVDFTGAGPLYAVGAGTILSLTNTGWPGGAYIALQLDTPPDPTHSVVYYAEDITPAVTVGQHVAAGQVIGHATGGLSGIEIGWANPAALGQTLAMGASGATPEGQNFLSWIGGGPLVQGSGTSASSSSSGSGFDPFGLGGIVAALTAPAQFFSALTKGVTYLRIGEVLVGAVVMAVGAWMFLKILAPGVTNAVGSVAGDAKSEVQGGLSAAAVGMSVAA